MAPRLALALVVLSAGIVGTATAQCGASTSDPFVPAAGATFHDGSGDGSDYSSSQTCWTKLSCPGQRVTLDLITFATERGFDKVMMFEGTATGPSGGADSTTSCKLPVELHGDDSGGEVDTDADITSDGEYLWLKFTSDEATETAGYSASFSCACGTPTYETACTGNNGIPNLSNAALTCPYEPGVHVALPDEAATTSLSADNSCLFANDGMCDDTTLAHADGFGCGPNTDCSDCEQQCDGTETLVGILIVLISVGGAGGGTYYCIQQKSKALGSRPQPMAYLASLLLFIFVGGPLFMWIPFVIDSCYEPRQTQVVIGQHQMPGQPVMANKSTPP